MKTGTFGWMLAAWLAPSVVLWARSAGAEPAALEPAALSWVRAEDAMACPAAPELSRAVEQRLGRTAFVTAASALLVVEAFVEALPGAGFRVKIALSRGSAVVGRRQLESLDPSCRELAERAALAIALAIDPEASLAPSPVVEAPQPAPAPVAPQPAPVPQPEPARPSATVPAAPPPWHGDLELAAGLVTGLMPRIAPGFFLRGRALPPAFPLGFELEGAYFPEQSVEARPGAGGHFTLFYAGAAVCSVPSRARRLRASVCAGPELGSLGGRGYGFDQNPTSQSLTVALAARARLWFGLVQQLAIVLGPNLTLPLKRDHFQAQTASGTDDVFRMSALGFGFELGAVGEL